MSSNFFQSYNLDVITKWSASAGHQEWLKRNRKDKWIFLHFLFSLISSWSCLEISFPIFDRRQLPDDEIKKRKDNEGKLWKKISREDYDYDRLCKEKKRRFDRSSRPGISHRTNCLFLFWGDRIIFSLDHIFFHISCLY